MAFFGGGMLKLLNFKKTLKRGYLYPTVRLWREVKQDQI